MLKLITRFLGLIAVVVTVVANNAQAQLKFRYQYYDSAMTDQYFSELCHGNTSDCDIIDFVIHRGAPRGGDFSGRIWRMGGVFAESPAVYPGLICPSFGDTLDVVKFTSMDIKAFFERVGWAAPQYDQGLYVSLVKRYQDSLIVLWHEDVSAEVFGKDAWNSLSIEDAGWVAFGAADQRTLALQISQSAVGAGATHGDDREAYWLRDSTRFRYLGQISTRSHGGWGMFHRFGSHFERRFEDVDQDGLADLLLKRHYGYGTGPNTDTEDRGWIAMMPGYHPRSSSNTIGRFEGNLRPARYVVESDGRQYAIGNMPKLVFPRWDTATYEPRTHIDSQYVRELDEMAFEDQRIKTVPRKYWPQHGQFEPQAWSGDGGASVVASLSGDHLILSVSLKDSASTPQYDIVVWTRPIVGTESIRFDSGDTLYANLAVPDSTSSHVSITQMRIIGDDSLGVIDTLAYSVHDLSRRGDLLAFNIEIPSELTSLTEDSASFGICHFAVEVIKRGMFGRWKEPGATSVSQSEPDFYRFHTLSWGTLAEGRRIDTPKESR